MPGKRPIDEDIREKAQDFRDVDVEYQFMAYLVRKSSVMAKGIHAEWFSDVILQDIFSLVREAQVTMTEAMLLAELRGRGVMSKKEEGIYEEVVDQVFGIDVSTIDDKSARFIAAQILRLYESRSVLTGCGEVISTIRNFDLDASKRKLGKLARGMSIANPESIGLYLDEFGERVDIVLKRATTGEDDLGSGVKTGIRRFDDECGGLNPQEFGVILGKTGVGKTAALVDFGVHAWENGQDVMIASGEMDKHLLGFRIDSRLTGIHGMKFRTGELNDADHKRWGSVINLYRATKDNILVVATYPRKFTTENVEQDMLRIQEQTGRKLTVLCLDYINILGSVRHTKIGWEEQSEAIWDFKELIADYNLVGWTAGQVKDDAYEKELYDPQDAKYARSISEAAPIIVALIRTPKDILENRMKFQVLKMRSAPPLVYPIALNPDLSVMRLNEPPRKKSLLDLNSDVISAVKKTDTPRPRRSLGGH